MSLLRSVWPARWLPPFRRGDWVDEEVVKRENFGTYDKSRIPDAKFRARGRDGRIEIEFKGEFIYVREVR